MKCLKVKMRIILSMTTKLTDYYFVYFLAMCTSIATAYENGTCSSKVIDRKETACFAQYNLTNAFLNGLSQPAELTYYTINMVNLCRYLDNLTACLDDAMSHCKSPYFDFDSYKRTLHQICLHQTIFREAEVHCEMIDVLDMCLKRYKKAVECLKYHIYLNRPGPPLADICTVLQNTRECIHINQTATCTQERSEFLTALYRGRFMSSICTADLNTTTNGNERRTFSLFLVLPLIFIGKMLFFC